MLRIGIGAVLLMLAVPAAAQVTGAIPPGTPALKRDVTVSSDIVRIGDMIDNAGVSARVPIFRAPDLGQTGSVPASRVIEAVRAHGLALVETRGVSEVAVTRASRLVTAKDLETRVATALVGQSGIGDPSNVTVTFEHEPRSIHLEATPGADLRPTRVFYDPRSGRFDITFEVPGGSAGRRVPLRLSGTALETVEALVLTRALNRGDVIKASDLAVERRPKAEARDSATATIQALGLSPRRQLRAGEILRTADLVRPDIVQRNETVTLVYEVPGLMLTVRGKAVESGAKGDTIAVVNLQSKRTVQGIVSAPGHVTIAAASTRPPAPINTSQLQPQGDEPR